MMLIEIETFLLKLLSGIAQSRNAVKVIEIDTSTTINQVFSLQIQKLIYTINMEIRRKGYSHGTQASQKM